jgi:hypothetical protein
VVNSEKELISDGEEVNFNVSRPRVISSLVLSALCFVLFFLISGLPTFCLVAALRLSVVIFFSSQLLAAHSAAFRMKHKSNLPGNNFINSSELSYFERDKWHLSCDRFRFDLSIF